MDSVKSTFKGYGKVVDNTDEECREFRRQSRRRLLTIGVSSVLLLLLLIVAAVPFCRRSSPSGADGPSSGASGLTMAQSIKAVCSVTLYPADCSSSLTAASANATSDPEDLLRLSLRVAADELSRISSLPDDLAKEQVDKRAIEALQVCKEMFEEAHDHLKGCLSSLRPAAGEQLLTASKIGDLRTRLSAAVTDQETCLDAFDGVTGDLKERLSAAMRNSTRFTSNSLAIASKILGVLDKLGVPLHRKLLSTSPSRTGVPATSASTLREILLQGVSTA